MIQVSPEQLLAKIGALSVQLDVANEEILRLRAELKERRDIAAHVSDKAAAEDAEPG
jgi:hypothetical protein